MSSEEEVVAKIGDMHVPVFRVKLCVWHHPVIKDYLKYIDKESQNVAVQPKRGSKLHLRMPTEEHSSTLPPKKLPRCLYNKDWLSHEEESKGKEWVAEELMVSQDVFELLEFVAQ